MLKRKKKAQSILEYAILMGIIIAVIIAIQVYVKRAVQGRLKSSADAIGDQFTTAQDHSVQTIRQTRRIDNTLTGTLTVNEWSESQIANHTAGAWYTTNLGNYTKLGSDYTGAELSSTDYVNGAVEGTQELGDHGTFDSGQLSNMSIFDDD